MRKVLTSLSVNSKNGKRATQGEKVEKGKTIKKSNQKKRQKVYKGRSPEPERIYCYEDCKMKIKDARGKIDICGISRRRTVDHYKSERRCNEHKRKEETEIKSAWEEMRFEVLREDIAENRREHVLLQKRKRFSNKHMISLRRKEKKVKDSVKNGLNKKASQREKKKREEHEKQRYKKCLVQKVQVKIQD